MRPCALCAALLSIPSLALAQPSWHASPAKPEPLDLLREATTANFPTTTTLAQGDFHFEISHRFTTPVKDGYDTAWGLDEPVHMRISLGYGLTDRTVVTLGRSNLMGNVDLQLLYRCLELRLPSFPSALAVRVGGSANTQKQAYLQNGVQVERGRWDTDNLQGYVQLVGNALLLHGKLGVGLVPSYLYNSTTFSTTRQYTFTLGNYYHYYYNPTFGAWLEYNPVLAGWQGSIENGMTARSHDTLAFGLSIETGGHFFYVFVTNNTRLNPSQYLVGGETDASPKNWKLAFGLTRHM